MTRILVATLCLLAISIIIWSAPAAGEEIRGSHMVRIRAIATDAPDTEVVYQGERGVDLYIWFGKGCSEWTVDVQSPLFVNQLDGYTIGTIEAGDDIVLPMDLEPEAEPGVYVFMVYLNYTTDEGNVNSYQEFRLTLKRSLEVADVQVPHGGDHHLSVTFETFQRFHNVTVLFGGNGDVGVEDERIVLEDVEPGRHTVETTVVGLDQRSGNDPEVSWRIIGVVENRTIERMEFNIPVDVSWGIPGSGASLVLIAMVSAMVVLGRVTRPPRQYHLSLLSHFLP